MRSTVLPLALMACLGFNKCHDDPPTATDTDTDTETTGDTGETTTPEDPGALTAVETTGAVGWLLDGIPAGPDRDAVAADILALSDEEFEKRAANHMLLTYVRLTYRPFFCYFYGTTPSGGSTSYPTCGQLPLPPTEVWDIQLAGAPTRTTIDGHDLIMAPYSFYSVLVSDLVSPGRTQPELGDIGGSWVESFVMPADPMLLFERTEFSCMDEIDWPPNSVFEKTTRLYYDDSCVAGNGHGMPNGIDGCHQASAPKDCVQDLEDTIGRVNMDVRFTRIPWDQALADAYQVGDVPTVPGSDMVPVVGGDGLAFNDVNYRFIREDGCELDEQCVNGTGWRKVIQFNAQNINVGGGDIELGDPTILNTNGSHMTVFSDCHKHYHLENYAEFGFGEDSDGGKRAFCVEGTDRKLNGTWVSLDHGNYTCADQGLPAGWSDQYPNGIDCQFVDVTDEDDSVAVTKTLSMDTNPLNILCEGVAQLDSYGNPIFVPSGVLNSAGEEISIFDCDETPGAADNNHGEVQATIPPRGEGFITEACIDGDIGADKDCGWSQVTTLDCTIGDPVHIEVPADPTMKNQAVRVCELSAMLGPIACTYLTSFASEIGTVVDIDHCPEVRDNVGYGGVSIYTTAAGEVVVGN